MRTLLKNELYIGFTYYENIRDPKLISQYFNLLNHEELSRYKAYHFEKHKRQFIVTRALMRSVLSAAVKDIAPENLQFSKNRYGKPFLSNDYLRQIVSFNISHTEKLAVIAVCLGKAVGIDAEFVSPPRERMAIADRYFPDLEKQQLHALQPEARNEMFFDLWTLKEAYIKACGMGLSIPLDNFSFSFSQDRKIAVSFEKGRNDDPESWQFWQIRPSKSHIVSVALKNEYKPSPCALVMREIVPLCMEKKVDFPVIRKSCW